MGYMVTLGLISGNLICSLIIAFANKADPNMFVDNGASNLKMYYKPWTRCGAYFVGVFFGLMFWDYKNHKDDAWNIGKSYFTKCKES